MRKIRIIEHISLDGVIQAPGGPSEDGDGAYKHGGWAVPHFDPAVGEAIDAAHGKNFDLLLGRRTYDIFAGYWPKIQNSPDGGQSERGDEICRDPQAGKLSDGARSRTLARISWRVFAASNRRTALT